MMCESVCVIEGKEGLSRREQLCQVLDNVPLLGVAYCLASARLTDAVIQRQSTVLSTSINFG